MAIAAPRIPDASELAIDSKTACNASREPLALRSDDAPTSDSRFAATASVATAAAEHIERGRLAELEGRPTDALFHFARAVQLEPESVANCCRLALALRQAGQAEQAALVYETAVALSPKMYAAWHNLGEVQRELGLFEKAVDSYRQALVLAPSAYETQVNLAEVLADLGEVVAAHRALEDAEALQPERPETQLSRASILRQQGRLLDAERCLTMFADTAPRDPQGRYNLALIRLESGQFAAGWQEYECRWLTRLAGGMPPRLKYPLWQGEPLAGRAIRVRGEQGLGDEIMFASCLPDLLSEAGRVQLTCDARLQSLFCRSFPQALVLRRPSHGTDDTEDGAVQFALPWGAIDYEVPAGSLPRYLRTQVADFPLRDRFLMADPERRHGWRQRLDALGPGLKVGLAWRAGRTLSDIRRRSVPLAELALLGQMGGVHWVSLQHGVGDAERSETVRQGWSLAEAVDFRSPDSLEDLAACIAELDLVIAVAGTALHLAGALGTQARCWLPPEGGWRWTRRFGRSLWYPSVQIAWAQEVGRWSDLISHTQSELIGLTRQCPPAMARSR